MIQTIQVEMFLMRIFRKKKKVKLHYGSFKIEVRNRFVFKLVTLVTEKFLSL